MKKLGVLFFIITTISISTHAHQSYAIKPIGSPSQSDVRHPVVISLYYESLCPYCNEFVNQHLCLLWKENRVNDYFKIEFVPYGNAETRVSNTGKITFQCQHGPPECEGNIIQACALKYLGYEDSVNFICCMEGRESARGSGSSCAEDLGLDYKPIDTCAKGDEGVQLHYLLGKQTSNLNPPHLGVPWILFNSQFDEEAMDHARINLLEVLCYYMEDPKPEDCKQ